MNVHPICLVDDISDEASTYRHNLKRKMKTSANLGPGWMDGWI